MSELTVEDVGKLKVADLKTELAARDLPTKGLKKELADRLVEHIQGGGESAGGDADGGAAADPSGQVSGDQPELADGAEKHTESLPGEMPAVPPAAEDSVQDLEGAEPTLSEEKANGTNEVETAAEPSEVVRPDVTSVDQTPGFVASTTAPEDQTSATNRADDSAGAKRKLDEVDAPAAGEAPVPPAVQAEEAASANDTIPAPPADVEEPDTKRLKTGAEDSNPAADAPSGDIADIPVPSLSGSDIPVPSQPDLDILPTASSSRPLASGSGIESLSQNGTADVASVPLSETAPLNTLDDISSVAQDATTDKSM